MTTQNAVRRTITCTVKGVTEKEASNGSPYRDIQVQVDGRQYPEVFKCWDQGQLLNLKPGSRHAIILERSGTKPGKTDDGQAGSYWWNAVGETELLKQEPQSAPTPNRGPAPVAGAGNGIATDPRQASIERQVAFKAVIDLLIAGQVGNDIGEDTRLDEYILHWTNKLQAVIQGTLRLESDPLVCEEHTMPCRLVWDKAGNDVWAHWNTDGTLHVLRDITPPPEPEPSEIDDLPF